MIIINEAKKLAFRTSFSQRINHCLFAERKDKNTDEKADDISEESLGNYRGLVYSMRKDANIAKK